MGANGQDESWNRPSGRTIAVMTPEESEPDQETRCGFGSWHPAWLRKAANPKLFFFLFSVAGLLEGAQFTYIAGILSTLEKRFSYDTRTSGYILITEEFGPICFGILIGYFGGKTHRPRVMAIGMLMGCLSNFIMAMPYFIYGAERLDESVGLKMSRFYGMTSQFCDEEFNVADKDCTTSVTVPVILLLVLGIVLKGIGNNIFYTLGTPYIDDIVKKKNSPSYLGILFALRLLGPTVGYLLSSVCLQFYEDPSVDPGFSPEDPRWVGAWWAGFVFLGVAIFLFSAPILLFPRRLPTKYLSTSVQKQDKPESPLDQIKNLWKGLKRLMKNPILVLHFLGGILRLNGFLGYYLLLPKYMEMQFRQTASKASLYSGPASIIGMQIGILFGGFAIRKFRPSPKLTTGGIFVLESFTIIALLSCMFMTCPSYQLTGANSAGNKLNLENNCNKDCVCDTEAYTPVCGPDGKSTYFSPCYAGCTSYNKTGDDIVFKDCKCVHDSAGEITVGDAEEHYCDSECQWMITFIVVLTAGKLLSAIARVPSAVVMLRCVSPEDKSLSFGLLSTATSFLCFIPYAMIYGSITDSSCLVWEESCGRTGNCWIYDTDMLRLKLHGVSALYVFLGSLTDIFIWLLSSRLRNLYEDE